MLHIKITTVAYSRRQQTVLQSPLPHYYKSQCFYVNHIHPSQTFEDTSDFMSETGQARLIVAGSDKRTSLLQEAKCLS